MEDGELLAMLIGTGIPRTDVLELARRVEGEVGGIRALSSLDPHELMRLPGLGHAKVARIFAAIELGRRICMRRWERGEPFTSSRQVFSHCHLRLRDEKRERFVALYLDGRQTELLLIPRTP